ncbi:unnamed protein product [Paramecium pentaurelia]|uniref:Uncharacterized protein n=1 Tax=Paramecium pentaurelia TaxID=43138 RepID=A0A8S1XIN6_9CILI|nr:unnamed protein product [Paramecium pentaurelia]
MKRLLSQILRYLKEKIQILKSQIQQLNKEIQPYKDLLKKINWISINQNPPQQNQTLNISIEHLEQGYM